MAGKRPSFDLHIKRAVQTWWATYGAREFTSKELLKFMKEEGIDQMSRSQVNRMTPTSVSSRLAYWAKAGKMEGLFLVERNPHRYRMVLE